MKEEIGQYIKNHCKVLSFIIDGKSTGHWVSFDNCEIRRDELNRHISELFSIPMSIANQYIDVALFEINPDFDDDYFSTPTKLYTLEEAENLIDKAKGLFGNKFNVNVFGNNPNE